MTDILLFTVPKGRGHRLLCRVTWRITRFGQVAEAGATGKRRLLPLLGFLQERKDRTGKQLKTGYFE